MNGSKKIVEIYKRVNKLKLKAGAGLHDGPGQIDPRIVERAQTVIHKKEHLYRNEIETHLEAMSDAWNTMKTGTEAEKDTAREALYHYANHIKDIASVYEYALMQHFGESLREFCERIDTEKPEHLAIVQAHIDVMMVTFRKNIKGQGDEMAQELKAMVEKAVDKYI